MNLGPPRIRRRNPLGACLGLALAAVALMSGCARTPQVELPATPTDETGRPPTPTATVTPAPPDTAIVCLAEEPRSLYLYADTNRAADAVLSVVYDGPVDLRGYTYRPVILERIPGLGDDDAVIETVTAATGDVYLNPETLEPETLQRGKPFAPAGCRAPDCLATYNGGAVEIDRLRVTFRLRPGTVWSDGEPLQASDSVFSYEIDGHPDTPTPKYLYARTLSYRAVDTLTVEWVGIPGFLDADFGSNFWTPLPEHVLGGFSPAQLVEAEAAAQRPLGWGPYQLADWQPGAEIRMERNPYYRTEQGAPAFESLVFRFPEEAAAVDQLQTGECDVLDEALVPLNEVRSLQSRAEAGGFELAGGPGPVVERMDLNLQPVEVGGGEGMFGDVRTRRAIAACIDRPSIAERVYSPYESVPDTFLPAGHPLHAEGGDASVHDPERAVILLEEVGWRLGEAESEVRTAAGVEGIADGTRLAFDLLVLQGEAPEAVGQAVAQDLRECGIEARPEALSSGQLFAGWPDGPAFGRTFSAVIWAWPAFATPACEMFASWEIPSDDTPLGVNASGFADEDYDAACRSLLISPSGSSAFSEAAATVQSRLVERVPTVPLLQRPRLVAHAAWLCGVELDPSAATALWNVEDWRPCPP